MTTSDLLHGAIVVVIVWLLDLQLLVQSVHITTDVLSSIPAHSQVYSIKYYVIKFVSDLRQVGVFSPDTPDSSTNKTDRHDIAEILLKATLSTTTPTPSMLQET
jgi:hypothetical protein